MLEIWVKEKVRKQKHNKQIKTKAYFGEAHRSEEVTRRNYKLLNIRNEKNARLEYRYSRQHLINNIVI